MSKSETSICELPPLPKGDIAADTCPVMWVHTDQQIENYAREAIEPYKQRIEELEALQSQDAEDAERYRRLRKGDIDDVAVVRGLGAMDYGASAVIATYSYEIDGDDLDAAIDHARRVEGEL